MITIPFAFLFGGGLVPTFMGVLGDRASFSLGFILLGVAFLASMALLPFLRIPPSAETCATDEGATHG